MSALRKLQQDFAAYLTESAAAIIENVVDQGNIDRTTRLNIYQNAYNIRLRNCIETDHPMLGLYLGDDLFDQMVTAYINQHPSHYPSLRQFCDQLPDYLSHNEPFKSVPIIAEIATFERRLMDAFDAVDSETTTESELQNLPTENWPEMKLVFHPSVQVFEAHWNSVECWQALKNEGTPPDAQEQQAYWIIWRDRERLTQYRNLTVDGFVLYQCFKDHYTFADACELLKEHLPEDQIGLSSVNHLQSWFSLGMIRSLDN
jgi:hypothetical protein